MNAGEKIKWNIEIVESLVGFYGLELKKLQQYHLRIIDDKRKLDYFPKTGRATWVSSNKWFSIPDIEKFMDENFK